MEKIYYVYTCEDGDKFPYQQRRLGPLAYRSLEAAWNEVERRVNNFLEDYHDGLILLDNEYSVQISPAARYVVIFYRHACLPDRKFSKIYAIDQYFIMG